MQAQTDIIRNIQNPSISATYFNGFAMKIANSPIVQLQLSDSTSQNPYLSKFIKFKFIYFLKLIH